MSWTYQQSSGKLSDPAGAWIGTGYSGHAEGLNNPRFEADRGVGPVPQGRWTIGDPLDPPDHLGPIAMPLTPAAGTETFGRSAFFIHGDNVEHDKSASHGCIVIGRADRAAIAASSDRTLVVFA